MGGISGDNVDGTTNIVPRMSLTTLREGYKRIISRIYSPDLYYERVKRFLRNYRPRGSSGGRIRLDHLYALGRSVLRLGVLGKERIHFWRLLGWTITRRPSLLPLAVTFAIYGYHFRKVGELHVT